MDTPIITRRADIKETFNPLRMLADMNYAARAWFYIALISILIALIEPYLVINAYRTREKYIVIDPAENYILADGEEFKNATKMHREMGLEATVHFFDRNPKGLDRQDLYEKIWLLNVRKKSDAQLSEESREIALRNIHQKCEVFSVATLETSDNQIIVGIKGQLIRTGTFEEKGFSEVLPFKLKLTMARNPDMVANKKFPLGVVDYQLSYQP